MSNQTLDVSRAFLTRRLLCSINIRSATNVYRTLGDYIKAADVEAAARGEGPEDKSIDADFRSGVALGLGYVVPSPIASQPLRV